MKKHSFWYRNGLTLVFSTLFIVALLAQVGTGHSKYNQELADAGLAAIGLWAYLHTGHCISSTFENFQSEFLQMALYVALTINLRQIGG